MADFIKRQKTNLGRQSRLDVSSYEQNRLAAQQRNQNMLFALGSEILQQNAKNDAAAYDNYLQTRAVHIKNDFAPKIETAQSQEDIDKVLADFADWENQTKKDIFGNSQKANALLAKNGNGRVLEEQTAVLVSSAKLNLAKRQGQRQEEELIKAAAANYALTKNEETKKQIDDGLIAALSKNRSPEEVNKLYSAYQKQRDIKLNENEYLAALSLVRKNPQKVTESLLNPKKWTNLSATQREHLLNAAEKMAKGVEGTVADNTVDALSRTFAVIAQGKPLAAQELLKEIISNPGTREFKTDITDILGKDGAELFKNKLQDISFTDYKNMLSAWRAIAESPDSFTGQAQIAAAQNIIKMSESYKQDSADGQVVITDILHDKKMSAQDLAGLISEMNGQLKNITEKGLKKEALVNIEKAKVWMGRLVKQEAADISTRWFSDKKDYADCNEYAKDLIVTGSYGDGVTAELYYRFLANAAAQGIDLNDNSAGAKQKCKDLLNAILKQEMELNYNMPKEADAVVAEGKVVQEEQTATAENYEQIRRQEIYDLIAKQQKKDAQVLAEALAYRAAEAAKKQKDEKTLSTEQDGNGKTENAKQQPQTAKQVKPDEAGVQDGGAAGKDKEKVTAQIGDLSQSVNDIKTVADRLKNFYLEFDVFGGKEQAVYGYDKRRY